MNRRGMLFSAILSAGAALSVLIPGCAGEPQPGREEISREISERLGQEVSWPEDVPHSPESEFLEDGVLSVDEAVRLALTRNRILRATLERLNIAHADMVRAVLLPNPMLDAELLFVEGGGGEIIELRAAQSLLDIVLIPIRRQVARERFEQTKQEVMGAILDLAAETRIQYRRLQAEEEMVALLTSALDATWFSYDAARRLREAGNIIELDVLRREAVYEELKIELARSKARAHQLREGLNLLLGLWQDGADQWRIQPRLPEAEELDLDLAGLENRVIEASLDLEAARREILALGHELNLSPVEAIFEHGSGGFKAEKEGGGTWALGPTAGLSIPLFNFGQAATEEGAARLRQAYETYTELAIRIRRSVRAAYVEAATSGANARYLREKILPLRARITRQSRLQFNAMQIGVLQLLDSKRREIAAGRRYVETLRDHWVARTRLEGLLLGRLLDLRYGLEGGGMQASASAEAAVASGGGH